jgi:hypothetical protein
MTMHRFMAVCAAVVGLGVGCGSPRYADGPYGPRSDAAPTDDADAATDDGGTTDDAAVAKGACSPYVTVTVGSLTRPVAYCDLWHAGTSVLSIPASEGAVVGVLGNNTGNWFLGQQQGERWCYPGHPDWCNSMWAFTAADNGYWGWVSEVFFDSEVSDPDPVLVDCDVDPTFCQIP